jgi:hypothetical protein
MRILISAVHPLGFPVQIEVEPSEADSVESIVERIMHQGYTAPLSPAPTTQNGQPSPCPVHGELKPSVKEPGTYFCPGRRDDGGFCQVRWPPRAAKSARKVG